MSQGSATPLEYYVVGNPPGEQITASLAARQGPEGFQWFVCLFIKPSHERNLHPRPGQTPPPASLPPPRQSPQRAFSLRLPLLATQSRGWEEKPPLSTPTGTTPGDAGHPAAAPSAENSGERGRPREALRSAEEPAPRRHCRRRRRRRPVIPSAPGGVGSRGGGDSEEWRRAGEPRPLLGGGRSTWLSPQGCSGRVPLHVLLRQSVGGPDVSALIWAGRHVSRGAHCIVGEGKGEAGGGGGRREAAQPFPTRAPPLLPAAAPLARGAPPPGACPLPRPEQKEQKLFLA